MKKILILLTGCGNQVVQEIAGTNDFVDEKVTLSNSVFFTIVVLLIFEITSRCY